MYMIDYFIVLLRIITIMLLLLLSTLYIMGKRPIGELPVFDFLTIIVIGAIAGADIADPKIEHLPTAFAIVVLALFQRFISLAILKSRRVRKLFTFEPTIIVRDGQFIYNNIKNINYTLEDILMLLREKNIFDITRISCGIIEANGQLSVFKKPEYEAVTVKDLNIKPQNNNLPVTIVLDGKFMKNNIESLGTSELELTNKLKAIGFSRSKDIFYASMDQQGNIHVSPYKTTGRVVPKN